MNNTIVLICAGFVFLAAVVLLFILKRTFTQELLRIREKIDGHLTMSQTTLLQSQQSMTQSLQQVSKDLGAVTVLGQTMQQSVRSFESILQKPKLRGGMGEYLLETLIKDALPEGTFKFQYAFSNNTKADAVILFPQGILAIDAKFSLEDFNNLVRDTDNQKEQFRKIFIRNIKDKINQTSKYILPAEGTFDFVFMYVPSENIYYEIVTLLQLSNYASSKNVFVVGPNTFYAYLKTILIGFQGLALEKETKKVFMHLKDLQVHVNKFQEHFSILGSHLNNAMTRYHELDKRMQTLSSSIIYEQDSE